MHINNTFELNWIVIEIYLKGNWNLLEIAITLKNIWVILTVILLGKFF